MTYRYDPQLSAQLKMIPPVDFSDLPAARLMSQTTMVSAQPNDRRGVKVQDIQVPAFDGAELRLRIITPHSSKERCPLILDLHPGGFCSGSIDIIEGRGASLARELEAVVVAVDYRLAPEYPYPIPLEDCYSGLLWLFEHAHEWRIDPDRIILHGQSGGGGLAAGLALLVRDRSGPQICFQYLGVPEIDDRLVTPSMIDYVDTPLWNRGNAILSWKNYLGALYGGDVPIYAAPARAKNLKNLPPAYICVMQFDPLRDEGIAYASKLAQAGIPVELHLFPGTFHGSMVIGEAKVSQRELEEEISVLRRAIGS